MEEKEAEEKKLLEKASSSDNKKVEPSKIIEDKKK
jgi:hypothetical protein